MSARVISVAHTKGGIGKTTITVHLATALAIEKGLKVVIFDTDSQQSAAEYRKFEQEQVYEGKEPPYPIEFVQPKYLFDDIRRAYDKYDAIFIDVPRMTETGGDSQITTALSYCDSILVPIVAGELEALSTKKFVRLLEELKTNKEEKGYDFEFHAFLNKKNRRKENDEAITFMKGLGVPMFENALPDVKALSRAYTYESIMATAEGRNRFKAFFDEFVTKFEL